MSSETAKKNAEQIYKGRLYRQICYGLSWHCTVQAQVPAELWALIGHGWPYGALVKSSATIQDPVKPGLTWNAWLFMTGVVWVKSSAPGAPYILLHTIGQDARANPADAPTAGI